MQKPEWQSEPDASFLIDTAIGCGFANFSNFREVLPTWIDPMNVSSEGMRLTRPDHEIVALQSIVDSDWNPVFVDNALRQAPIPDSCSLV